MASYHRRIEMIAAERAKQQAQSVRWNVNIVAFTYSILAVVMLLRFENIRTEIVLSVAIAGLVTTWFLGRMRENKLYKLFYEQELAEIGQVYNEKRDEALTQCPLPAREEQVLKGIARGQPNKMIAYQMGISEQTVKNYVSDIMRKLDASDRTQAVVFALQNGWVSLYDANSPADVVPVGNSSHQHSKRLLLSTLINAK